MENKKESELTLIPKSERYIQYMLDVILKLPRTEKFSIGTEYKNSMYKMLRDILYISKIEKKERFLEILYQSMMISEIKIVPLHYVSETPPRRGLKK